MKKSNRRHRNTHLPKKAQEKHFFGQQTHRKEKEVGKQSFFNDSFTDPAHDPAEREADEVANQIVNQPTTAVSQSANESVQRKEQEGQAVQRMEEEEAQAKVQRMEEEEAQAKIQRMEEEEPQAKLRVQRMEEEEAQAKLQPVQKKAATEAPQHTETSDASALQEQLRLAKGKGAALPDDLRSEMEGELGISLASVRIHTDSHAVGLCQQLSAQAFTYGYDIFFNAGKYNPNSPEGKRLLAHELAHVVQQKGK